MQVNIYFNFNVLLITTLVGISISSCQKEDIGLFGREGQDLVVEPGAESFLSNYEYFTNFHFHGFINLDYQFSEQFGKLDAMFFSDYLDELDAKNADVPQDAGNLMVNNQPFEQIISQNNHTYAYTYNAAGEDITTHIQQLSNFPGQSISFILNATHGFAGFQESFDVSLFPTLYTSTGEVLTGENRPLINKSEGYMLRWKPDVINQGIVISVSTGDTDEMLNPGYKDLYLLVNDDGEFFIKPEYFNKISSDKVSISLYRMRFKKIEKQGFSYLISCRMNTGFVTYLQQ